MPKFVIERNIPGLGGWTAEQLQAASQTSCGVLNKLGPQIQWLQSYATKDKLYCIYIAPNAEMVREHADAGWVSGEFGGGSYGGDRSDYGGVEVNRGVAVFQECVSKW